MPWRRNKLALWGSLMLLFGAVGHLIVVDLSTLQYPADFVTWNPSTPLPTLENTTIHFGPFGKTNAFLAFAGFSVWLPLSLIFIAAHNMLVFRFVPVGNKMRVYLLSLNFIMCVVFFSLATACFIYPASIAGGAAAVFFALAWRKEKSLK